jgi:hypothetical protein
MGRANALKPGRHKGSYPPLSRAELPVDTVSLARYLIGKILEREMAEGVASGRIVETEAYVVGDAAGHAYRGMTPRNRSLFLERKVGNPARVTRTVGASQYSIHAAPDKTARQPQSVPSVTDAVWGWCRRRGRARA